MRGFDSLVRVKRLFHNPSRGVAPWILDGIEDEERGVL